MLTVGYKKKSFSALVNMINSTNNVSLECSPVWQYSLMRKYQSICTLKKCGYKKKNQVLLTKRRRKNQFVYL